MRRGGDPSSFSDAIFTLIVAFKMQYQKRVLDAALSPVTASLHHVNMTIATTLLFCSLSPERPPHEKLTLYVILKAGWFFFMPHHVLTIELLARYLLTWCWKTARSGTGDWMVRSYIMAALSTSNKPTCCTLNHGAKNFISCYLIQSRKRRADAARKARTGHLDPSPKRSLCRTS